MKKKNKIIGTVSALAVSMAMLTGGVLAASQVSLDVSSTVSFNATGVYLKAEGQVKRGTSEGSLQNLTTSTSYTYTGYSYNPNTSGEPDGTAYSNTAMRDQAGSTAGWQIGEVEFTESEKVLQYAITFTNYSEFDVSITITPNVAVSLTGVTTSSSGNEITVAAKSGETPGTASYTFTMTLTNFSSSVSGTVGIDIDAKEKEPVYTLSWDDFSYSAGCGRVTVFVNDSEVFSFDIFSGASAGSVILNPNDVISATWENNNPEPMYISLSISDGSKSVLNVSNSNTEDSYIYPGGVNLTISVWY
ncbi:MAG TPA: hypothetical protein IAA62_05125 [Candidatus Caccopulliclostridium gallistercoris]|uniref:Uncharacterized protein n=1 Tax=Candidatus Caccopulliclostridium gallistercoris TaxID=2840719 RepID=A0A9D1NG12_9FIRM|nr:hypothetical protein [Candidatus Caccopulliclostridium gallistercoris]